MGKLFIVPTPIGNLQDITFRAISVLKEVNLILAEDTRTSTKLLQHYEIFTPVQSHHMHNEHKTVDGLVKKLKAGETLALISDAGTPAISDPGFLLTRACVEHDIEVECLPGPTAFVPALVNSGIPNDRFVFEGFIPVKKGRQTRLELLAEETRTMVFTNRHTNWSRRWGNLLNISVQTDLFLFPELTKIYEETIRGTAEEVHGHFSNTSPKGEFVIVVAGRK